MAVEVNALVRELGKRIGFGALMVQAQKGWRDELQALGMEGGEFSVGPCEAAMVPCPHTVRDSNGHCEICCGSGKTTQWVADLVAGLEVAE